METIEILTGVLVLITGYYAWITGRILNANKQAVSAMQEQNEALSRPYINISHFLGSDGMIYLRIENTGRSNANHLELQIDKDFYQLGVNHEQYKISNLKAFREPLKHFPPGSKLDFALLEVSPVIMTGQVTVREKDGEVPTPHFFSVKATYSFAGKVEEETTGIDLSLYHGTFKEFDPIAFQLAKIRQELHEIKSKLPPNVQNVT